jgi:hypothetical protein
MTVCHYILFLLTIVLSVLQSVLLVEETAVPEKTPEWPEVTDKLRCFILCLMQMIHEETCLFQECHHYIRKVWRYQRGNQKPYIEEKTDWHNISEILLKVALNTINLFLYVIYDSWPHMVVLLISLSQEVLTLPEYRNSSPIYILITGSAFLFYV